MPSTERDRRLRVLRVRVFDVIGLIEDDGVELERPVQADVAPDSNILIL
jgi:hypothetical protein